MERRRVFITGIGIISPVGLTRETTWDNLVNGVSGIDQIRSFDPDGLETTIAAEVNDFDPTNYVSKKQAHRMDRLSQLAIAAYL